MKKKYYVKQNELFDCGAACLEMIIEYYGGYIGVDRLSDMLNATNKGINAYNIVNIARKLGFKSYGTNEINTFPCIALIKKNHYYHYIVIEKKHNNYYHILDPDKGIYKMNIEEFNKIWEGISLNFIKEKPIPKINTNNLLNFIINFVKKNKSLYFLIIISSFIIMITSLLYSLFYKIIINNSSIKTLLIFILLLLIKLIFLYLNNLSTIKSDKIVDKTLSKDIFSKLINLPYMYFKNHTTGEILNRFSNIFKIRELINKLIITISLEIPLLLVSILLIFYYSKTMFYIIIITSFIYVIFNYNLNKKCKYHLNNLYDKKDETFSKISDTLICYEGIKGCNKEDYMNDKLNDSYNQFIKSNVTYNKLLNKKNIISNLILGLGNIFIIYIGINKLDFSTFLIINSLYIYINDILNDILDLLLIYNDSNLSYKRIYEFDIKDEYGTINKIDNYDIKFKNVNFKYGFNNILNNFNLEIKHGEKILIYGDSGNGKSTLSKLIKRYYKTNNLYIGNNNINNYTKKALNKIIYISQNETLFSDTLKNNLLCEDVVEKYVNLSYVDEILNKNKSDINMLILDQGFNLSGGEKQRIVLLRSILNEFEILIIDESLSQLDINLERNILINLLNEFKDKTIIFITHRLDNKDLFKKIIKIGN